MMVRGFEIGPELIMSLIPATRSMVINSRKMVHAELSHRRSGTIMVIKCDTEKEFNMVKFEHIKYLKTLQDPQDRVGLYECEHVDGGLDFQKMERLIEGRKTVEEKKKEIADELELMQAFKKAKIPYNGFLSRGGVR